MLVAVILTIGTIAGSVHAAEASGDGENPEMEESRYRIVLDANGGYFDHEWDDIREEYVEREEIVNKVIMPGESVKAVPAMETDNAEAAFLGWSKERGGDILPQEEDGSCIPEKSCTLYALWEIEEIEPEADITEEAETEEADITEDSETVETEDSETEVTEYTEPEEPEEAGTAMTAEIAAEEEIDAATTAMTAETEIAAEEEPEAASAAVTTIDTEIAAEAEPDA